MIIFYNKKTGDIIATINGRMHDDHTLNNVEIRPKSVPPEDIGKYVAPLERVKEEVEVPITEMRVVDRKSMRVEKVVTGKKKIERVKELRLGGGLGRQMRRFEAGKDRIRDFRFTLNKDGEPTGFERREGLRARSKIAKKS